MFSSWRRVASWLPFVALAVAGPLNHAAATRVVHAPHVDVLYDDPAMAGYAQRVAADAERQLLLVAHLFGRKPFPIYIRLQANDDVFNAFGLPIPRPHVTFRPLFPIAGLVGFHSRDLTELVLRHEITHLVQLTDTRVPPGATAVPRFGLVGSGTAILPPAWLLEGIAVWVESNGGLGGRLHDARTRAVLWTMAAAGTLPSLADVSLITYARWPGGRARYLLGGSFIDYLVHRHGFAALVRALHVFQAGSGLLPFDRAWKRAVGTDLEQEWAGWTRQLRQQARRHRDLSVPASLMSGGPAPGAAAPAPDAAVLGAPALGPDGRNVAWPVQGGVRLATWAHGALAHARTLATSTAVESLTWLDAHTLVLAAMGRGTGRVSSDLFALDLRTGRLRRLTHGAHAHLPRAAGRGCVLYVRDGVPEGSSLRRWCPDRADARVWSAPRGEHVVGLAVSKTGRIALSIYHPGGVDLALLSDGRLRWLTRDAASELEPRWEGERAVVYAADGSGLFQLYRRGTAAGAAATGPLTAALGGAEDALPLAGGLLYRTVHGDGFALAWRALPVTPATSAAPLGSPSGAPAGEATGPLTGSVPAPPAGAAGDRPGAPPAGRSNGTVDAGNPPGPAKPARPRQPYPDRPYSPWPSLLPYGWWPSGGRLSLRPFAAGLELTAVGLDDSARHALDLTLGYDTGLHGVLGGGYGYLRYAWNMPNTVQAPGPPAPLGVAVRLGAWPHGAYLAPVTETAYGIQVETLLQAPVGRFRGAVDVAGALIDAPSLPGWRPEGGFEAVLDDRTGDAFGMVEGGERFAVQGRWSYGAAGASAGAWAEAAWWPQWALPVQPRLALSAGYRPTPPVPVALPDLAAVGSFGTRWSVPVGWRVGDGLAALDRLDVIPTLRLWGGAGPPGAGGARFGVGGDVALWADAVVDYDGLMRVGVRGGYADGWWVGLGFSLPY